MSSFSHAQKQVDRERLDSSSKSKIANYCVAASSANDIIIIIAARITFKLSVSLPRQTRILPLFVPRLVSMAKKSDLLANDFQEA